MYQALYRKWRPKTFSDVIGQSHITETLRKQVAEGRTSHAYLFTGTRGTGKTTCAKILAKAVNCEHPEGGDPCCRCPSCLGIENGSFLDVMELDAASNNGVDQVRALRDEAIYAPANVKKRVYIVDEVHMLSVPAFNALLKILEEPPEHLMFILATTELHKVPATILSRCQRFSFKRITPQDIAARLLYVAGQEGIELTADGAELLSRLADGALRDGLSLLDQCAASGGTVDSRAVLDALGLAGNLQTAQLLEHVLRRDAQSALLELDRLYQGGRDVGAVLGELSTLVRDLLLRRTVPEGGAALLSGGYDAATLDRLGRDVSAARLIHLAATLQKTSADLYYSTNRRTDAELCLLRLCDETLSGDLTALAARVDRLEESARRGRLLRSAAAQSEETAPAPVPAPPPAPRCGGHSALGDAGRGAASPSGGAPSAGGARGPGCSTCRRPRPSRRSRPGERRLRRQRRPRAVPKSQTPPAAADRQLVAGAGGGLQGPPAGNVPGVSGYVHRRAGGGAADSLRPRTTSPWAGWTTTGSAALSPMRRPTAASPCGWRSGQGSPPRATPRENLQNLLKFGSQFDNIEIK